MRSGLFAGHLTAFLFFLWKDVSSSWRDRHRQSYTSSMDWENFPCTPVCHLTWSFSWPASSVSGEIWFFSSCFYASLKFSTQNLQHHPLSRCRFTTELSSTFSFSRSNLVFFCLLVCAGCWLLCFLFSQHSFSPDTLFELTALVLGPSFQGQQLVNVWQHLHIYICAGIRLRNCCLIYCSVGLFLLALFQMLVNASSPPLSELIRRLPSRMALSPFHGTDICFLTLFQLCLCCSYL